MKPADKQKKATTVPPRTKTAAKPGAGASSFRFSALMFNVLGAIVAGMLISAIFQHHEPDQANPNETHLNSGYDWLLHTMLVNNLKTIDENPDKTVQQRYELKWGQGEITYVNKIKEQTPETAIILLPPKKTIQEVGFKSVVELPWITYFLYPRRVVYEDDKDKSALYAQATHIVSINGYGIDKVRYAVEKTEPFMVLPINK